MHFKLTFCLKPDLVLSEQMAVLSWFIVLGTYNFEPYQNCQFQYVCESSQSQGGKGRGVEFGSTQWNFASSGF